MILRYISLLWHDPMAFLGILLATMVALAVAISVHELSHGLAAFQLGDNTAQRQGRLTLNPLAHLDPIGTILLFIVGFGWGKPVPVNPFNLKGGARRGMAMVAASGPVSNLAAAALFALPLRFALGLATDLFLILVLFNVVLAVFNLIPLPPLDGFQVVLGLLPQQMSYSLSRIEAYGPVLLIGILALDSLSGSSILGHSLIPLINLFGRLVTGFSLI